MFFNAVTNSGSLPTQTQFFERGTRRVASHPDNCAICLEPLSRHVIQVKACGHFFHRMCAIPWFRSTSAQRGTCPNCRCDLFRPNRLLAPPEAEDFDEAMIGPDVVERQSRPMSNFIDDTEVAVDSESDLSDEDMEFEHDYLKWLNNPTASAVNFDSARPAARSVRVGTQAPAQASRRRRTRRSGLEVLQAPRDASQRRRRQRTGRENLQAQRQVSQCRQHQHRRNDDMEQPRNATDDDVVFLFARPIVRD